MLFTSRDHTIFEAIEAIRTKRKAQDTLIALVDYGAGDPEATRSHEQMYQGVPKETTIAQLSSIGLKGEWAQRLYSLVQKHRPKKVLELGTCCGFSAIYMAKACSDSHIYTLEGDPNVAALAKENIKEAGCENITQYIGRFQDVLPTLLQAPLQIDFAFIDGHHDKEATVRYLEMLKPYLSSKAVVVFDDISWSQGMQEAWEKICKDSFFESCVDMKKLGICFVQGEMNDLV
ncbi:MAG: class I SAM-dependent methyltransferase [Epsilonproteobacteria bacterium]|nr:class I SAM-dependent methyltransferase [Campylobacterota bacterium]